MKIPLPRAVLTVGFTSVAIGATWLVSAGCHGSQPAAPPVTKSSEEAGSAAESGSNTVAATDSSAGAVTNPLESSRAFGYLTQLCNLGPRFSGSSGMVRQQAMLVRYFEQRGARVSRQEFLLRHPLTGQSVRCANILVEWHPETTDRVLLCAHYDTRPFPDQDPDPRKRHQGTFVGANDGASGVALLMELAYHLPKEAQGPGIDFVLFDAEELVYGGGIYEASQGEYFEGSTFFATEYKKNPPAHRYRWGVLVDMVGDTKLELLQEKYSLSMPNTRPLVKELWTTAARLGVKEFVPRTKRGRDQGYIKDDHLPLNNIAGIPTCDIIDGDYPDAPFGAPGSYWHTEQDVPANCSGESVAKVGWVILEWYKSLPAK